MAATDYLKEREPVAISNPLLPTVKTDQFLPIILSLALLIAVTVYLQHARTKWERESAAELEAWREKATQQTLADQQAAATRQGEKQAAARFPTILMSPLQWNNPPPATPATQSKKP